MTLEVNFTPVQVHKTSDGSLKKSTVAIYVREDQAAIIHFRKKLITMESTYDLAGNLIAGELKRQGDFFTFPHPITEIVIAGGSFIGGHRGIDSGGGPLIGLTPGIRVGGPSAP